MGGTSNQRLLGLCAGFLALLGVLWIRCVWLQVLQSARLAKLAAVQHHVSRPLPAQRGTIYDRTGRALAMSVRMPSVFANPRQMDDKADVAVQLASVLGGGQQLMAQRLDRNKGFVWLARQVDPDLKEELLPLRREGIGLVEESKRVYPNGTMAAHLLGDVDIDEKGLEGLELGFNGLLQGSAGWLSTIRDAKGDLLIGPWSTQIESQAGLELVLTIDGVVQSVAEEALAWGVEKFHAKGGSLIVMDPHSGAILALANQPSFDPNHPGRAKPDARRNRAITDLAEPGSVFKVVTASALLEEHLARLDERVFCEQGSYHTVGHHVLHDHTSHGSLSFQDVITYSSNIGTAKLAQRLTPETLYRYIRLFGFGQKTGIEAPGEVSGIVPPPAKWSKLSPFIIPIGQEVAVTPMQLAVMLSAIANGGWKVQPHLIARIQDVGGQLVRASRAHAPQRILSLETADQVQTMLTSVVESGTGQLAKVQGLTVAGKTGTAQKLEPAGHYSHSRFVASFVGYGPVPDPRFVMVVTVDEPHPQYFGGSVSAPIFRRVVEQLVSYWELKPPVTPGAIATLP